jgi:multidrug efflux pump subunit AcrB
MNFIGAFISRPVATTLLTIGVGLAGLFAYPKLAVSPLPQVDFPTIMVQAQMPGASPEVMASSVTAPLERHLGQIADVTEITSQSSQGSARITLQFGLNRDINGAARDVEAAVNAAHADLPTSLKSNPSYRKYNPADAPILILALSSRTRTSGQLYDSAATILQQKLSQIDGVGNVDVGGSSLPAVRIELNPSALAHYGIGLEDVRAALASANANSPKGAIEEGDQHYQVYTNDQATHAADYQSLVIAYRNGSPTRAQQDTGLLMGGIRADASISFQLLKQKLAQLQSIVQADPAVESVVGYTNSTSANVFVTLKPLSQRRISIDQVTARLRVRLSEVAGAQLFLVPMQDVRIGGRQSLAQYQFTLQADNTQEIYEWAPKLTAALQRRPELTDVNSDQQRNGLETDLVIDRPTAARLGLDPSGIDNTLYDAFGQRQVSTIYNAMNQYHVVMEVAPKYWQSPETLKDVYVSTSGNSASGSQKTNAVAGTVTSGSNSSSNAASIASDSARNQANNSIANTGRSSASSGAAVTTKAETMVPLGSVAAYGSGHAPVAVNHQGAFVASTISFNLPPGESLSDATTVVRQTMDEIRMPVSIHGTFAGVANAFQSSLSNEPVLIVAALAAVYVVLGILYESYIHPITILSTLPPASVGALLGLMLFNMEFSIIAMIGVILLIGIVKKNAIMMVDFALQAERRDNLSSDEAIYQACLVRFRPIMMTSCAASLGALPLAFTFGEGSELRQPLGISIVGGMIVSQLLTLYSTPVIYLYLDRLRLWLRRRWQQFFPPLANQQSA